MFCSKCGKEIPEGTAVCPYCSTFTNAPTPPPVVKKKKSGKGCLIAVVSFFAFCIILGAIINSAFPDSENTNTPSGNASNSSAEVAENYTTVYEDKKIKVSFIKFENNDYINTINMYMLVENKTNTAITVSIGNVSINGMSTNFELNGATNISPKESSKYPYTIALGSTDVEKSSDIKKIRFKIKAYNSDTFKDVVETGLIQMTFEE